jgi:hypothetical protein
VKRRESVQSAHLSLEDIADDMVLLRGGSYRAVLEVRSVNFDLMSPGEREAVIAGYTGWLNGLGFPVQILMRVLPIDVAAYLDDLAERTRDATAGPLAALASDHLGYVHRLVRDRALLERRSYVVVPTDGSLEGRRTLSVLTRRRDPQVGREAARSQLTTRCREVERGLARCGLTARRLSSDELAELMYACWCPELSRTQRLRGGLSRHTGIAVTREAGEGR